MARHGARLGSFRRVELPSFSAGAPNSQTIGAVQGLATDTQGNLWILLQSTKVLRYRDGKFEFGPEQVEFGITSVGKRNDGTVLLSSLTLGTLSHRAGKFETLTTSSVPINSAPSQSAEINDNLSTRFSWSTGIVPHRIAEPNSPVTATLETSDGRLWLGTQDKGLFYLNEGKILATGSGLTGNRINCLLSLDKADVWIGTDRGLFRWNGEKITDEGVPPSLRHEQVSAMIRDRDSNIWVGTADGLVRVGANRTAVNGQARDPVTALFEDREGNLWVGAANGIERLRDSAFITFPIAGPKSGGAGPVYMGQDERVWFAPLEGGLHWLKGEQTGTVSIDGLAQDVVYSIAGENSELWIGRQRGGLTHLRYAVEPVTAKTYTKADGLAQNSVYAVYRERDGTVWAGTLSAGVSQYRDGHFTTYTTANGLASNTVASITQTPDDTMWFATPNGVTSLAKGQWRTFGTGDGLPSEDVTCLFADSTGTLWIGTASGLAFFRSGHLQNSSAAAGTLQEPILGIAEDKHGGLWVSTSNHVLRVKRDRLVAGVLNEADVREYEEADGLNGTEGVKRQQSAYADPSGRIWISTNRGLSVVDPIRAMNKSAPVLISVVAASAGGNAIDLARPIRLPSGHQRISFSYAGLSLSAPERVRYRYRLDGFDQDWSEPVVTHDAVYTNLSPGPYTFRVIACNSEGLWNEAGANLAFNIVPEFYQTQWFPFACALAAVSIGWAIYQRHIRQMTARLDMQFKERLSERTRIARELHDTLLQSFQGLILHFQRSRNVLPAQPEEAIHRLDAALERAEQAIVEGRNAIHDIRSSALVDHDLPEAVTALGEELRIKDGSIKDGSFKDKKEELGPLKVVVEGTARPLDPILRDEIYRIVREALRNAFSHAAAQHIEAEIVYGEKLLRVRIRDDGKGIDPMVLQQGERAGHWGLPGMRERAKQMGGHLDVWSESGAGTEIELSIPGSIAYDPPSAGNGFHWFRRKTRHTNDHGS